jgi:hypothetical protein
MKIILSIYTIHTYFISKLKYFTSFLYPPTWYEKNKNNVVGLFKKPYLFNIGRY